MLLQSNLVLKISGMNTKSPITHFLEYKLIIDLYIPTTPLCT
jgi:hypothetical protein